MKRLRSSYSSRFASGSTNGASASISSARSTSSFGRPPGSGFRCSARSISVSVFRYWGTSEFVDTTRPSATRVAHAGSGRGEPSTPTTHMRQPPYGSSLSSWQRVGMKTPWRAAACTRSSPSGAATVCPSSVNSTTRPIAPILCFGLVADPFTAIRVSDIEAIPVNETLVWRPVRRTLGVTAFGVNAYTAANAGDEIVEDHDERGTGAGGHEELYVVVTGHVRFEVAGEEVDAPAGTLVFVRDPSARRGARALEPGSTVLAFGGRPGEPYEVSAWEH